MASLCHITKEKQISKIFAKTLIELQTCSRLFCVCKELSTTSIGKRILWSDLRRYVIVKLSKFVQINMQTSSDSILQKILWKLPGISFHVTFFNKIFWQKFSIVILRQLAKFHNQISFTSEFIQQNVFHVSCLGIWWCNGS